MPSRRLGTLAIAAAAAGWMLWMVTLHPAWTTRPGLMGGYYVGLVAFSAVLVLRSPLFGFFAFTGYVHALRLLPGGWRYVGVAATSVLAATSQTGGPPRPGGVGIATYLIVVAFNMLIAGAMSLVSQITYQQSQLRKQMIGELEDGNRRLESMMAENAGLHVQLLAQAREAGVADERQRMAREIHDTLAQGLTGIITQLEAATRARHDSDPWRQHLDQARALARESLTEARRTVQALRPESLDDAHLPDAIAEMAKRWAETAGIQVDVETTGDPRPLLPDIEVALYRVAQEALANVGKHAQATRVGLTLSYLDDVVLLDVRDDGVGFAPDAAKRARAGRAGHGYGLAAMAQRLRRVAGGLEIESSPGEGTAISASVPALAAEGYG
jgi:signal transduction histidine kinase